MEWWPRLVAALVAGVVGILLGNWWNRGRPLVVLQAFTEVLKIRQLVPVPENIRSVMSKCWHSDLRGSKCELGDMKDCMAAAQNNLFLHKSALDQIDGWIQDLDGAEDNEKIRRVVQSIITHSGAEGGLVISLLRNELTLEEPDVPTFEGPVQSIELSEENEGCYVAVWRTSVTKFALGLKKRPKQALERLSPLIAALRYLHRPTLLSALNQLKPLLQEQINVDDVVIKEISPVVNGNSRFSANLMLANYGGNSMMLWPEASILVREKSLKKPKIIEGYVVITNSEGKMGDLEGVYPIAPGERVRVLVVAEKIQEDLEDGRVLRTYFEDGAADANVKVRITHRSMMGRASRKSNRIVFQERSTDAQLSG